MNVVVPFESVDETPSVWEKFKIFPSLLNLSLLGVKGLNKHGAGEGAILNLNSQNQRSCYAHQ